MPRTPAEKERIEKRIRLEKTVIPIVCVFALALFIILSAVFGKKSSASTGQETSASPAATQDPVGKAVEAMAEKLGGEISSADDSSSLSFKSPVSGKPAVLTLYYKTERLCMRLTEETELVYSAQAPTPQATENLFVIDDSDSPASSAGEEPSVSPEFIDEMAGEMCTYLSFIDPSANISELKKALSSKLAPLFSGDAKKSSFIFGLYLVELEYSSSDGILRMKCDPA